MASVVPTSSASVAPPKLAAARQPFLIMIDGQCPLCTREGAMLERMDRGRHLLRTVDITQPEFDPSRYGRSLDDFMGQIHGVLPSGEIITGMAVFRRAYALMGWGWLWAPTGWPILRPMFDAFYRWFARNRMRFTLRYGWKGLFTGAGASCESGRCQVGERSK